MPRTSVLERARVGLTTSESPFIEEAVGRGQLYIHQPYELYSEENHEAWRRLYARMRPRWQRYANRHFLHGIESLCLNAQRVPRLEDVNRFLSPLTGFQAKPVSGYVPAFLFFDCLRNRSFPTTITIRRHDKLDYLPEPDIFHDIAGHVPMHNRDSRVLMLLANFNYYLRERNQDSIGDWSGLHRFSDFVPYIDSGTVAEYVSNNHIGAVVLRKSNDFMSETERTSLANQLKAAGFQRLASSDERFAVFVRE